MSAGTMPALPAAVLYDGSVMHARLRPKPHRFTYRVFTLAIDLDRLAEAGRASPLFSIGRFNLLSFRPADHGPRDGSDLRCYLNGLLAAAGMMSPPARVTLLCYPRVLGLVFNPISVYFAQDAAGALVAVVYEVRNTFGDMHTYVAPVRAGELSEAGLRQERDKLFYVSPFMGPAMRYHFRLRPPGADVALRILETDAAGPLLSATFHGRQRPLTTAAILALGWRVPLLTLTVVAGIHFEAAKLWFKGIRFHHRPPQPPAASLDGQFLPGSPPGNRA
jgi:DUF1365 family protein